MAREQRQIDELRCLCGAGAVARAVDLAHQHFADFGRDEAVLHLLGEAIEAADASHEVRRRYVALVAGRR